MLKIGDFSSLSRVSIRMLRNYDEIGLLRPDRIDEFTGYRYYSESQLPVAGRIVALKDMGFGLSAIEEILRRYDDPTALAAFLAVKRAEIETEAREVQRRLLLLDTAIERLRKDDTAMNYNVTLKTVPERYVASLRQIIPAYDREGELWAMLCEETAPLKLRSAAEPMGLAVFHDKGYRENDVDVEIQTSVVGQYSDTEHVRFKTVPAVEIASATYQGSYDQLRDVNHAVAEWVRDNGYEFAGASFCIYHVSPGDTRNPAEYVTEVCYPVRKK